VVVSVAIQDVIFTLGLLILTFILNLFDFQAVEMLPPLLLFVLAYIIIEYALKFDVVLGRFLSVHLLHPFGLKRDVLGSEHLMSGVHILEV